MYMFGSGGVGGEGGEWMKIGFGHYQTRGNRGSVGRVFVFELRWCRWGVGLDQGLEGWCGVMYV